MKFQDNLVGDLLLITELNAHNLKLLKQLIVQVIISLTPGLIPVLIKEI